jgi:hypothetical protein
MTPTMSRHRTMRAPLMESSLFIALPARLAACLSS